MMFRHWHTIALTLIIASVAALLLNAESAAAPLERAVGMLSALALLILMYIIARGLMGDIWALLPVIILGFAPPFLALGTGEIPTAAAPLAFIAALWTFAHFIEHPSRQALIAAGAVFGLALLAHPLGFILTGAHIALAFAALVASIAVDWNNTDPATRRPRFFIRAMRYARATCAVLFIGLAMVYVFFAVTEKTVSGETNAPLVIAWLMDNAALRPLGAYFLSITRYADGLPPINWSFPLAFATSLPLPLLGLFAIALWSAASGLFGSMIESVVIKTPLLLNHIATNPVGFALQLGTALLTVAGFRTADADAATLLVLPPLTLLAASAVKRWFVVVDELLARNAMLRVLLFAQNIWSVSLKALALAALIIALVLTTLIAAPEFAAYTNVIGLVLR